LKSSVVLVEVEDKRINTDLADITSKEEEKSREVKTSAEVAVQKIGIPNEDLVVNSTTTTPEGNQGIATDMIRKSPTKRTIYRHLNHKGKICNQSTYHYHSEHK